MTDLSLAVTKAANYWSFALAGKKVAVAERHARAIGALRAAAGRFVARILR